MRMKRRYPVSFAASVVLLLLFVLLALVPPPHDPNAQNLQKRFVPPSFMEGGESAYLLGTDYLGRDVASRIMRGMSISFFIALVGTVIGAIVGITLGYLAARFKGIVDELILMGIDIQASLPFMLLAIAFLSMFDQSFWVIVILLGFAGWEKYARLTRALTLSAYQDGYCVAVQSLGGRPKRVFFRHILPNISSALIVNMTLNFPGTMIAESSRSFLGLGIQPPLISLGRLLGEGRVYLLTSWWITVFPGVVIFLSTLAMSIIGDRVRDHLGVRS
ncbi:MAG: ABC transporter permease [Spirochaetaceae bacterium JB067]